MSTTVKIRPILMSGPMVRACRRDENPKTQTRRIMREQPEVSIDSESFEKYPYEGDSVTYFGPVTCPPGCRPIRWFSFSDKTNARLECIRPGVNQKPTPGRIKQAMLWQRRKSDPQRWAESEVVVLCPYGQPGDVLWVRETVCEMDIDHRPPRWAYKADQRTGTDGKPDADSERCRKGYGYKWRSSIHMPYAACRLWLEVLSVRVERVRDIGKDGRKAADVLAEGIEQSAIDHWAKCFHPDDSPALAYAELWVSINGNGSWAANPWAWRIEFRRTEKPQ